MRLVLTALAGFVALALTVAMFTMADWDLPPVDNEQTGYRGTAMVQIRDVERLRDFAAANQVPETLVPLDTTGPKASEVYENVTLLGDLSVSQFTRLMLAITEWVSPEEGCNYCHIPENLASDDVYTKDVARTMIAMTQAINTDWTDHVGQTGATCYTCHRGENVPADVWYKGETGGPIAGMFGYAGGQNTIGVGLTSMHSDPFTAQISEDGAIPVAGPTALPTVPGPTVMETEQTYALMIHMSEALGVNCTFCHNTRAPHEWTESTPQRMTAWHGIRMVRDINNEYLEPITDLFPADQLGPQGDVAKVNCATCHQGQAKPLGGASMVADFPSLRPQ